jgi:OFA family oxalate/formate antiporter-like MFS transporter
MARREKPSPAAADRRTTLEPLADPSGRCARAAAIGAVYAWSVFAKALHSDQAFGWTKAQATVPFEVAIGMIFVGSYIGGRIQDRRGPRVVAVTGGVIYSLGVITASFAD